MRFTSTLLAVAGLAAFVSYASVAAANDEHAAPAAHGEAAAAHGEAAHGEAAAAHGEAAHGEAAPAAAAGEAAAAHGEAAASAISSIPGEGTVTVTGKVTKIEDGKKFTVEDSTGKVDVKGAAELLAQVKEGLSVTVTGEVKKGLLGLSKEIEANKVVVAQAGEAAPATDAAPAAEAHH